MLENNKDTKRKSKTDWGRVDGFTDDELTANAKADHDNPPLDDSFYDNAKVISKGKNYRGKQAAPTKERISIRLSPDVLAHFRATGAGWQTKIDESLKKAIG